MKIIKTISLSDDEVKEFLKKYLTKYIEGKTNGKVNEISFEGNEVFVELEAEEFSDE